MARIELKPDVAAPASMMIGDESNRSGLPWEDVLVCPRCGGGLKHALNRLVCRECRKDWQIADNVPCFADDFPYRSEIQRSALLKLNEQSQVKHWKAVLLQSEDDSVRKAADALFNLESANWLWLTGLSPQSRVLDISAGLGTYAHALAMHFREVVALDPVPEHLEFMKRRFAQDGIQNIRIIRSAPWDFPFPPGSFDLVVLNGILPWLAVGRNGNPRALQIETLKKAFELLTPGGRLYIGAENRMLLNYFLGLPDPCCGLPYVTVLPRWLAGWYARMRGRAEGYRNYLYSLRGYRKLLAAAGFKHAQFYLAMPSHRTPRLFVPLRENVFASYHQNFEPLRSGPLAAIVTKILTGLSLLKYTQHSFIILAQRET